MNQNPSVASSRPLSSIVWVLLFLVHATGLSVQAGGKKRKDSEPNAAALVQVQKTTASQSGSPDKPGKQDSRSDEIRRIDSRLEMFVDDYLIERLNGTSLKLHPPVYAGVAMHYNEPWEGTCSGLASIIKDGDLYRMYYRGLPYTVFSDTEETVLCYAESRDGITWTRPKIGLVEFKGSKDNNILFAWSPETAAGYPHNFTAFLDTRPGVPREERLKGIGSGSRYADGWTERILYSLASGDGIHWKKIGTSPKFPLGRFDTQNSAFWSETEQCYVLFCREYLDTDPAYHLAQRRVVDEPATKVPEKARQIDYKWRNEHGFRTIAKATSTDMVHWQNQRRMTFGDSPLEEIYTISAQPYFRAPHVYIGTSMRYVGNRYVMTRETFRKLTMAQPYANAEGSRNAVSDTIFMTSRGGYRFDRLFMEAFIRPGLELENWAARNGATANGLVQTGAAELSVYVENHYAQASARLARFTLRLDGFGSVNASYKGGELITKPLAFKGSELLLNFSTSAAGSISVELQDQNGDPIPGFTLEESELIVGDSLERAVVWREGDLRQFNGRPIRLRFVMTDADLYSIRFR